MTTEIRDSVEDDWATLESLYPQAFPDEDLLPLLRDLLPDTAVATSLVATIDAKLVGHAVFTRCGVDGSDVEAALLGPLAVSPGFQRQGIGSVLVRAGLRRVDEEGAALVLVLGDPGYYGRFGFRRESSIEPPYSLPVEWTEAWQSMSLKETAAPSPGTLSVPRQWRNPALWAP